MKIGTISAAAIAGLVVTASLSSAQTVFVDEDFESYGDTSAVEAVWLPVQNAVNYALIDQDYITVINSTTFDDYPLGMNAFNPDDDGSTGKGLEFAGSGALEIDLPTLNGGQPLLPSATESVVVRGDLFDVNANGNQRRSIGLRSSTVANLLEMGFWNDPSGYAHRAVIFEGEGTEPNWDVFPLAPELDGDDENTEVGQNDIGEAWHRYEMIVTPDTLTFTLDFYRDGLDNATGLAGVDSTVVYEGLVTSSVGFDKIRFGGPSGVASGGVNGYGGVVFDNIYVALEDSLVVPVLDGDYNGDGVVDAIDYTVYSDTLGDSVTAGEGADGNGNGAIDPGDYDVWANNYGAAAATATAIPEPTSLLLVAAGLVGAVRRR